MGKITSILILFISFLIILYLLRKQKVFQKIGIFFLIIISVIRWDIGNDYANYYTGIKMYSAYFQRFDFFDVYLQNISYEPIHTLLIYLAKDFPSPPIVVLAIYSILTILLWYLTLQHYKAVFWGFFTIIFAGFLFLSWDQVRQGLAIAIFLYSIKFIDRGCMFKYFLCVLLAFCAHYSAIILVPFYFLRYITFPKWTIIAIIFVLFAGFITGVWSKFFLSVFQLMDKYAAYALTKMDTQEFSSGLGLLARLIIYTTVILLGYKDYRIVSNIVFAGLCIYLFSCSNELIERLSNYGMAAIIILFPLIIKGTKFSTKLSDCIRCSLIFLLIVIGTYNASKGVSGCIPYDTVFSHNYEIKRFRIRNY